MTLSIPQTVVHKSVKLRHLKHKVDAFSPCPIDHVLPASTQLGYMTYENTSICMSAESGPHYLLCSQELTSNFYVCPIDNI